MVPTSASARERERLLARVRAAAARHEAAEASAQRARDELDDRIRHAIEAIDVTAVANAAGVSRQTAYRSAERSAERAQT